LPSGSETALSEPEALPSGAEAPLGRSLSRRLGWRPKGDKNTRERAFLALMEILVREYDAQIPDQSEKNGKVQEITEPSQHKPEPIIFNGGLYFT